MIDVGSGFTLLLGGARSGKSDLAIRLARSWDGDVTVAATAEAGDDDMAERIRRHQEDRPSEWSLIEARAFSGNDVVAVDPGSLLIVDCITMLVTNLLLDEKSPTAIDDHISVLAHAIVSRTAPTLVISNEVGMGIVPETELGRDFRDLLGRANRRLAERAEATMLIVAGQAMQLENIQAGW